LACQYGLAAVGERAAFNDVFVCGQHWSLAAAISKKGYIVTRVVPGSFDSFDIFDFVAEQVVSRLTFYNVYLMMSLPAPSDESFPFRTECTRAQQLQHSS
jgi:hypothetical protein